MVSSALATLLLGVAAEVLERGLVLLTVADGASRRLERGLGSLASDEAVANSSISLSVSSRALLPLDFFLETCSIPADEDSTA